MTADERPQTPQQRKWPAAYGAGTRLAETALEAEPHRACHIHSAPAVYETQGARRCEASMASRAGQSPEPKEVKMSPCSIGPIDESSLLLPSSSV